MKQEWTWEDFPIPEADLRTAARAAGQVLTDALPQPEDCAYRFSQEFQRKMDRLVRKVDRSGWVTGLQRAACFFLALLLGGTAWLTVDAQARETFFGWVSQKLDNTQHYYFVEQEEKLPEKMSEVRYVLPSVPEEYRLEDTDKNGTHTDWLYVNDKGQYLSFGYLTQETKYATSHIVFSTGGSEKKIVLVHGAPAEYYHDPRGVESDLIVWKDEEQEVLLYIVAYLSESELIQMAESVVREEK
ncbi:MAG: DUF4367 domain-containing protein [Ruminiclostridium sp.]|nr:DUF4367 domain-containing protein [Ruminiclostridium sp.]